MNRSHAFVAILAAALVLASGSGLATTRDVANLEMPALASQSSVINQLTGNLLWDPYDELQMRPFNLVNANNDRLGALSPWQGDQGVQTHYVNALIGNNGATNLSNGSDAIQGSFVQQMGDRLAFGGSGSIVSDHLESNNTAGTAAFSDNDQLTGFDLRGAVGWRMNDRTNLGGGVTIYNRIDDLTDRSFEQGVGGFFASEELTHSGVMADFGMRRFTDQNRSWEAKLTFGMGDSDFSDVSESIDDTGAVTDRFVITDYQVTNQFIQLSGAYNIQRRGGDSEWQFGGGYKMASRELDNDILSSNEDIGGLTANVTLLNQDAVTDDEIFAHAGTIFLAGTTQIFAGSRLGLTTISGSTTVDAAGIIVTEAIDDDETRLDMILGFRQPLLWNDKLQLVISARGGFIDGNFNTTTENSSTGDSAAQTTTQYAIGFEGVLSNVTFDLAWLKGEDVSGLATSGGRQVVEFDRLVVSAMLAW